MLFKENIADLNIYMLNKAQYFDNAQNANISYKNIFVISNYNMILLNRNLFKNLNFQFKTVYIYIIEKITNEVHNTVLK